MMQRHDYKLIRILRGFAKNNVFRRRSARPDTKKRRHAKASGGQRLVDGKNLEIEHFLTCPARAFGTVPPSLRPATAWSRRDGTFSMKAVISSKNALT